MHSGDLLHRDMKVTISRPSSYSLSFCLAFKRASKLRLSCQAVWLRPGSISCRCWWRQYVNLYVCSCWVFECVAFQSVLYSRTTLPRDGIGPLKFCLVLRGQNDLYWDDLILLELCFSDIQRVWTCGPWAAFWENCWEDSRCFQVSPLMVSCNMLNRWIFGW